jgi:flagellar biogenesis protein FliO
LGYILTIVVLGAAGITILLRGGLGGVSFGSAKTARKLRIEETRAVGSRQQLVVAEYEGRKMLLGISQGRIDYLCGLAGVDEGREAGFSAALSEAAAHCPPQTSSQVKDILGEKVAKDGRPDA